MREGMKLRLETTDDVYELYSYETDCEKIYLHIDKLIKTAHYVRYEFVIKDESLIPMREQETKEWLKNSCKYGHWQRTDYHMGIDDLKFALERLQAIERI